MEKWRIAEPLLTSALDEGELSLSSTSHFTPGERAYDTVGTQGWVGPRANLHTVELRKDSVRGDETWHSILNGR
jgi:hypothetical protein